MAQDTAFEDLQQLRRRLENSEGLPFSHLLNREKVEQALAALGVKFRERIYSPVVVLWAFLSQVLSPNQACQGAVARVLAWRLSQGLEPCSTETTSYCEARQRLPVELLKTLVRGVAGELEQQAIPAWLWKGMHVKIADGTTAVMPDTPENQEVFPQPRSQRRGVGFPLVRVVAIFSLAVGAVLDLAIGPMCGKKTGENTLFRWLLDALRPGDLLLGDRVFCSFRDVALLLARNVHVVFRQHQTRKTDFRRGRWLAVCDHVVRWRRPEFNPHRFTWEEWKALPETMLVRELRFMVTENGFRPTEITLVTTLLDPVAYPKDEICELYRARWQCELDLRSVKHSLQMGRLRCKTPEMAEKEIWAHFLAYNLMRQTMAEAARKHGVLPRELSFMGAVHLANSFATYLALQPQRREWLWNEMLKAVATHKVGDRPNRVEPRKLKYRVGKYTYMTRPRNEERLRLCA